MNDRMTPRADEWVAAGDRAYHNLRLDEALSAYQEALVLQPGHYEAQLGLARTLTRQRREADAYAGAERLLELDRDRYEGHATLGTVHFLTDRLDEAVEALEWAMRLAPDEPEPHLTLAQTYADQGRYEEAHRALETALGLIDATLSEADREQVRAYALHVKTYLLLAEGRDAEAAETAQEVVALREANPHAASLAFSNLGILAVRRRDLDEAVEYLEQAFAMNPYFFRAGAVLGRILYVRRRYDRAAEVLGHVVAGTPEPDAATHYAYGMALAKTGHRGLAREQFRQALDMGLRGLDRIIATWQLIWQGTVGRYAVIALALALVAAWLIFFRPAPQNLVLAALFVLFLFLRGRVGRRG